MTGGMPRLAPPRSGVAASSGAAFDAFLPVTAHGAMLTKAVGVP